MRVSASLLFGLSTLVALWAAPDKGAALVAASLLLAGLGGAWMLAWLGRPRRTRVALLTAVALVATFVATLLGVAALPSLASIGVGDAINPNVLAAALAVLLPVGAAAGPGLWADGVYKRHGWGRAALAGWAVLWLMAALALVGSGSRGALAAMGGAACYGAAWLLRERARRWRRWAGAAIDGVLLVMTAAIALLWWVVLDQTPAVLADRAALWRAGLALIGDAPFTGAGLRSTMMALSSYVYVLHVGYVTHVHNLWLEMTVQQGLIGLLAWAFLIVTAVAALVQARRRRVTPVALQAALVAALAAPLLHGVVDAGLYDSRLVFLLFLPIGAAWAAGGPAHQHEAAARRRWLAGAVAPLAALALLFAWPGSRAAWQTNLGAVAQTQAELFIYTWPAWPIQDALRRSPAVDLGPALARYQAALALDPHQPAANRRLGQIALSQGDRVAARQLLQQAYAGAPDHPATRLLLGEIYALDHEPARAAALWATLDLSQGQLDARRWWIAATGTAADVAAFDAARAALGAEPPVDKAMAPATR